MRSTRAILKGVLAFVVVLLSASVAQASGPIAKDVNGDGLLDYQFALSSPISADRTTTGSLETARAAGGQSPILYGSAKLADAPFFANQLAAGGGSTRIMVLLNLKAKAKPNWNSSASRALWRESVAHQQAAFLNETGSTGELLYLLENVPVIAMQADIAAINYLAKHPGVQTVEAVRPAERHLAQGVGVMNGYLFRSEHSGAGVTVAIVDDGVDYNHPNLGGGGFPNGKVIGGFDFANNDAFPFPSGNTTAHGTACAGIAAGDANPAFGDYIGGVAPSARIVALKVFFDSGGETDSGLMGQAWDWAITNQNLDPNNPIMVISNSIGGGRFFSEASCENSVPALAAVGAACNAAGISVFASAGNEGYCNSITFPGCFTSVFGIGASFDRDDILYGTCVEPDSCAIRDDRISCDPDEKPIVEQMNPGVITGYSNVASFLNFVAPSETAFTTDILGPRGYNGAPGVAGSYSPANPIDQFSGTSAATPYAAGAAAVIQGAAKQIGGRFLTKAELGDIMTSTGTQLLDTKSGMTKPRPNIGAAITELSSFFKPNPPTNFTVSRGPGAGVVTLRWDAVAGANGYVVYYEDSPNVPPFEPSQQANPNSGTNIGLITTIQVTGLLDNTEYFFAIEAFNNAGNSGLTPIKSSFTGFDVPSPVLIVR